MHFPAQRHVTAGLLAVKRFREKVGEHFGVYCYSSWLLACWRTEDLDRACPPGLERLDSFGVFYLGGLLAVRSNRPLSLFGLFR